MFRSVKKKDFLVLWDAHEALQKVSNTLSKLRVCHNDTRAAKYRMDIRKTLREARRQIRIFKEYINE